MNSQGLTLNMKWSLLVLPFACLFDKYWLIGDHRISGSDCHNPVFPQYLVMVRLDETENKNAHGPVQEISVLMASVKASLHI